MYLELGHIMARREMETVSLIVSTGKDLHRMYSRLSKKACLAHNYNICFKLLSIF